MLEYTLDLVGQDPVEYPDLASAMKGAAAVDGATGTIEYDGEVVVVYNGGQVSAS